MEDSISPICALSQNKGKLENITKVYATADDQNTTVTVDSQHLKVKVHPKTTDISK